MTIAQARLKIWNPDSYTRAEVRDAAIWILARLSATQEDIDQATLSL